VSEVPQLTSILVDETAFARIKQQETRDIQIVSSQRTSQLTIYVLSLLIELTDKRLYPGSKGLSNCQISPRHLESDPHVRFCFS